MARLPALAAAAALVLAVPAAAQPAVPEAFDRPDQGHCGACHQLPPGVGRPSRADLGPALTGARMRELGKEQIRAVIHDPTAANPDTLMPPFGKHRILEPAQVDALVEFLHALP